MEENCLDSLPGKTAILYVAEAGSSPAQGSCLECNQPTTNPKFCGRSCAAKANNRLYPKKKKSIVEGKLKAPGICDQCESPLTLNSKKYCSVKCGSIHQRDKKIESWLKGETSGISTIGNVTVAVKSWLRRTRGDACEICGWAEINPITGKVPVVADHIDGDWRNNRPENLRLLCPNHDSLQSTYKALNKNGREWRRKQ